MKKKLLVLGSNGFLGKNLIEILRLKNEDIYDIYEIKGKKNLDIADYQELSRYFDKIKPNYVINCSSFVGGIAYGFKYPASILELNTEMIINIFKCSLEAKVEKLVSPISNCAYPGNISEYKEELFWDGKPHDSVFNYALTRRLIVALSKAYSEEHKFNSTNIVLSNMYGPNDHFEIERSHALGALVYKIYNAKRNNLKSVEIWGTGKPIREWLYVEDGANALIEALKLESGSHLLNVGVNKGISIKDLAKKIAINLDWNGKFIFDTSKPDGAIEKRVDGTKFQSVLEWEPSIGLDHGLEKTIAWYVNNLS